jgi:hypothetical protein
VPSRESFDEPPRPPQQVRLERKKCWLLGKDIGGFAVDEESGVLVRNSQSGASKETSS